MASKKITINTKKDKAAPPDANILGSIAKGDDPGDAGGVVGGVVGVVCKFFICC